MKLLTSKEQAFVEHYIEGGNATAAARHAGYSNDSSNAHRLVQRLASHINQAHQHRMARFTGRALSVLEGIISDEEAADRDRINAVSSYLDRAGVVRGSSVQLQQQNEDEPFSREATTEDGQQVDVLGRGRSVMIFPKLKYDDDEATLS